MLDFIDIFIKMFVRLLIHFHYYVTQLLNLSLRFPKNKKNKKILMCAIKKKTKRELIVEKQHNLNCGNSLSLYNIQRLKIIY